MNRHRADRRAAYAQTLIPFTQVHCRDDEQEIAHRPSSLSAFRQPKDTGSIEHRFKRRPAMQRGVMPILQEENT